MRQLCYNVPPDSLDENLRISKTVAGDSLIKFATAVVDIFGPEYLRAPNEEDVARIFAVNKASSFLGMWGLIDCMHWSWDKCPKALHGMYKGKEGKPTVILEAVASHDTWIWHAFFGMPGTLNDINVLNCSPFFGESCLWGIRCSPYVLNRTQRTNAYFLAKRQEGARKDVERTFALLQRRFWILLQSSRFWFKEKMHVIITCCIILHNMLLEDEREVLSEEEKQYFLEYDQILTEPLLFDAQPRNNNLVDETPLSDTMDRLVGLHDSAEHFSLQHDLSVYLWNNRNN